jgi:hypothetical protein
MQNLPSRTGRAVVLVAVLVAVLGAVPWGLARQAAAQETPSVDEIVRRANHMSYYQGNDGRARATLTTTDAQGRVRSKEFTILRLDEGAEDDEQKFYVYFHEPSDERGVAFMVWKHPSGDDDRWLYLPALDVEKRIAAGDKRTSFVGSNYFYEDVSGRSLEADVHELVEVTDNYFVVKNMPKDPKSVEFDSWTVWIHRATFLPVEAKYERGGEVYRVSKVLAVETIDGYPTVTKSQMSDLESGGVTVLQFAGVDYDIGLTADVFTERYLRSAPRQYLE